MTRKQLREITEARQYWTSFGELFGWRLFGWNDKEAATFITKSPIEPHYEHTIEILRYQRDDIMRAYEEQAAIVRKIAELDDPGLCRVTKGDKAMQIVKESKRRKVA